MDNLRVLNNVMNPCIRGCSLEPTARIWTSTEQGEEINI